MHSANARALTAAEIGEQDLQRRERNEKKQRPNTPNLLSDGKEEEIGIPATPSREPPPSTAPARLGEGEGEGRGKRKCKATLKARQVE